MLAHHCSRTIDEPIRILSLEPDDWAIVLLLWIPVELVLPAFVALGVGVVAALLVRVAKRGQPSGALVHAWWALGLPLPGWPPSPPREGQRYSAWS